MVKFAGEVRQALKLKLKDSFRRREVYWESLTFKESKYDLACQVKKPGVIRASLNGITRPAGAARARADGSTNSRRIFASYERRAKQFITANLPSEAGLTCRCLRKPLRVELRAVLATPERPVTLGQKLRKKPSVYSRTAVSVFTEGLRGYSPMV